MPEKSLPGNGKDAEPRQGGGEDPELRPDDLSIIKTQHLLEAGWMMEHMTGVSLADLLMSHLEGTELQDIYLDEDEDGRYLGLVFTDGEKEYYLTLDAQGSVSLAEGPSEGESLEQVTSFDLDDVTPPYSDDGPAEG